MTLADLGYLLNFLAPPYLTLGTVHAPKEVNALAPLAPPINDMHASDEPMLGSCCLPLWVPPKKSTLEPLRLTPCTPRRKTTLGTLHLLL